MESVYKKLKMTLNTRTMHTQKSVLNKLWWGAADQCAMSHGTYIHIRI